MCEHHCVWGEGLCVSAGVHMVGVVCVCVHVCEDATCESKRLLHM